MNTATAIDTKRHEEELNRRMFEQMIEQFTKRYRPSDSYDAAEFDSALFSLVRQIYRDAQQPLLDQITKIAMCAPIFPLQK